MVTTQTEKGEALICIKTIAIHIYSACACGGIVCEVCHSNMSSWAIIRTESFMTQPLGGPVKLLPFMHQRCFHMRLHELYIKLWRENFSTRNNCLIVITNVCRHDHQLISRRQLFRLHFHSKNYLQFHVASGCEANNCNLTFWRHESHMQMQTLHTTPTIGGIFDSQTVESFHACGNYLSSPRGTNVLKLMTENLMWLKSQQLKSHNGCTIKMQDYECLICHDKELHRNWNFSPPKQFPSRRGDGEAGGEDDKCSLDSARTRKHLS